MQQLIFATIIAFFVCLLLGPMVIPLMRRLKCRQKVRDDGPQSHLCKTGTPTMGGVLIIAGILAAALAMTSDNFQYMLFALLAMLGFGLVGFLDDIIKIIKKRSLGLRAYQKIIGQFGLALAITLFAYYHHDMGTELLIPFTTVVWDIGGWMIPLNMFFVIGMVNSVNLTDGLDGLACGVSLITSAAFAVILLFASEAAGLLGASLNQANLLNLAVFSAAIAGACLGFTRFNTHPAKIFMGDTGAFSLGGALAAIGVASRMQILMGFIGFMFIASSISVVLQVGSYKLRHKRIFKMAPLHHHFELIGVPEEKIVSMYIIITVLLSLIGLLSVA
ncbi:MAG: phospho-N-acetylmuramoyl-pentapeptide-transferase [Christensenellales bacterium]